MRKKPKLSVEATLKYLKSFESSWERGDFQQCVACMSDLIDRDTSRPAFFLKRAQALFELSRMEETYSDALQAIHMGCNVAMAHLLCGVSKIELSLSNLSNTENNLLSSDTIDEVELEVQKSLDKAIELEPKLKQSAIFIRGVKGLQKLGSLRFLTAQGVTARSIDRPAFEDQRAVWLLADLLSFSLSLRDDVLRPAFDPSKLVRDRKSIRECQDAFSYVLSSIGTKDIGASEMWVSGVRHAKSLVELQFTLRSLHSSLSATVFEDNISTIISRAKRWTYKLLECGNTALSLSKTALDQLCMRLVTDVLQLCVNVPVLCLLDAYFQLHREPTEGSMLDVMEDCLSGLFRIEDLRECSSFMLLENTAVRQSTIRMQPALLGIAIPEDVCIRVARILQDRVSGDRQEVSSSSSPSSFTPFGSQFDLESGFRPWNLVDFLPRSSHTTLSELVCQSSFNPSTTSVSSSCCCFPTADLLDSSQSNACSRLEEVERVWEQVNVEERSRILKLSSTELELTLRKQHPSLSLEEILTDCPKSSDSRIPSLLPLQYFVTLACGKHMSDAERTSAHTLATESKTYESAIKLHKASQDMVERWQALATDYTQVAETLGLEGIEFSMHGQSDLLLYTEAIQKNWLVSFMDEWFGSGSCLGRSTDTLNRESIYYVYPTFPENCAWLHENLDRFGVPKSILCAGGLFVSRRCSHLCHQVAGRESVLVVDSGFVKCECGRKGVSCRFTNPATSLWLPPLKLTSDRKISAKSTDSSRRKPPSPPQSSDFSIHIADFSNSVSSTASHSETSTGGVSKKKKKKKKKKPTTRESGGNQDHHEAHGANVQTLNEHMEQDRGANVTPWALQDQIPCIWPGCGTSCTCLECGGDATSAQSEAFATRLVRQASLLKPLTKDLTLDSLRNVNYGAAIEKYAQSLLDIADNMVKLVNVQNACKFLEATEHLLGVLHQQQLQGSAVGKEQMQETLSEQAHAEAEETFAASMCSFVQMLDDLESRRGHSSASNQQSPIVEVLVDNPPTLRRFRHFLSEYRYANSQLQACRKGQKDPDVGIESNNQNKSVGGGASMLSEIMQLGSLAGQQAREKEKQAQIMKKLTDSAASKCKALVREYSSLCKRVCEEFLVATAVVPQGVEAKHDEVSEEEWRTTLTQYMLLEESSTIKLPMHELRAIQWKQDQFQPGFDGACDLVPEEKRRILRSAQDLYPLWHREKSSLDESGVLCSLVQLATKTVACADLLSSSPSSSSSSSRSFSQPSPSAFPSSSSSSSTSFSTTSRRDGSKKTCASSPDQHVDNVESRIRELTDKVVHRVWEQISSFCMVDRNAGTLELVASVKSSCRMHMASLDREISRRKANFAHMSAALARSLSLSYLLLYSAIASILQKRLESLMDAHRSRALTASLLLEEEAATLSKQKKVAKQQQKRKQQTQNQVDELAKGEEALAKSQNTPSEQVVHEAEDHDVEKVLAKHPPIEPQAQQDDMPSEVEYGIESIDPHVTDVNNMENGEDRFFDMTQVQEEVQEAEEWTVVNKKSRQAKLEKAKAKEKERRREKMEKAKENSKRVKDSSAQPAMKQKKQQQHTAAAHEEGTKKKELEKEKRKSKQQGKKSGKKAAGKGDDAKQHETVAELMVDDSAHQSTPEDHVLTPQQASEPASVPSTREDREIEERSVATEVDGEPQTVVAKEEEEHALTPSDPEEATLQQVGPAEEKLATLEAVDISPVQQEYPESITSAVEEHPDHMSEAHASASIHSDDVDFTHAVSDGETQLHHDMQAPRMPPFLPPVPMHPFPLPQQPAMFHGPNAAPIPPPGQPLLMGPPPPPVGKVCRFHLEGSCRYGPRCRDRHLSPLELHDEMMMWVSSQAPQHMPPFPYPFPNHALPNGWVPPVMFPMHHHPMMPFPQPSPPFAQQQYEDEQQEM